MKVHPTISLSNVQIETMSYQNHLGVLLDDILDFILRIDSAISKVSKGISVIKKLDTI